MFSQDRYTYNYYDFYVFTFSDDDIFSHVASYYLMLNFPCRAKSIDGLMNA